LGGKGIAEILAGNVSRSVVLVTELDVINLKQLLRRTLLRKFARLGFVTVWGYFEAVQLASLAEEYFFIFSLLEISAVVIFRNLFLSSYRVLCLKISSFLCQT